MNIITRFAPSPTGFLHLGNVRTALINWLFTAKNNQPENKNSFILRIDDTDLVRSKEEYYQQIIRDLDWLGLSYDRIERQSLRIARYQEVVEQLKEKGLLYPCFESAEELEMKRKFQLSRGLPPLYDRASLKLSKSEIDSMLSSGRKPHYRFKISSSEISWNDMIRGEIHFDGSKLSDPILIREDGSMTYILCSCIDDYDMGITHIFRGEDHISNTAVGVQISAAIGAKEPLYGHLSLLKTKDQEMSKRTGGFDIKSLKEEGFMPMAINSLLARLGSSKPIEAFSHLGELLPEFAIDTYGKAAANYDKNELLRLNHKLLSSTTYEDVKDQHTDLKAHDTEKFFYAVRANLNKIDEIFEWDRICNNSLKPIIHDEDKEFLQQASKLLPENLDQNSWDIWINALKNNSNRKGKELFMPLRLAITGIEHGPELKIVIAIIDRNRLVKRLCGLEA
jgi:glutamyl-tRNA synthetase